MPRLDDFFGIGASQAPSLQGSTISALSVIRRRADGKWESAVVATYRAHPMPDYRTARRRPDPVSVLEEQGNPSSKNSIPVRMARMLTSPFALLGEGAEIAAGDLANCPRTDLRVNGLHGDVHLLNFGLFASAERNLIFAINGTTKFFPGRGIGTSGSQPRAQRLRRCSSAGTEPMLNAGGARAMV